MTEVRPPQSFLVMLFAAKLAKLALFSFVVHSQESRDKQFLLMRLNEVTGESSHGSGSSKKGQLSRLAKPQGTEGTTATSDLPPSYDSMGSTITKTE